MISRILRGQLAGGFGSRRFLFKFPAQSTAASASVEIGAMRSRVKPEGGALKWALHGLSDVLAGNSPKAHTYSPHFAGRREAGNNARGALLTVWRLTRASLPNCQLFDHLRSDFPDPLPSVCIFVRRFLHELKSNHGDEHGTQNLFAVGANG